MKPFGLFARVAGLALATLMLAQGVSFAVVAFWPAPAAPTMVPIEAIGALKGDLPVSTGLLVRKSVAEPRGESVPWLATLAAERLGLPRDDVRAVWRTTPEINIQVIDASRLTTLGSAREVNVPGALAATGLRLPAFELGVREAAGGWRVVSSADSGRGLWRRQVLIALMVGALLIAPMAWWMARRLTLPLQRLADASARLELASDAPLVPVEGAAEVRVLALAIAQGQQRLRRQANDVTGMLAAIAHDLRTPLTGLRLRAESAPEPARTRMIADIERMRTMITQVLAYAQGELKPLERMPLDLAALAREVRDAAVANGHDIRMETPPSVHMQGDALALRRALSNLVENGVRYAADVEIAVESDSDTVCVEVRDRGPGIPASHRERLLQPFQRLEYSRSRDTGGAGLGLAIARTVALHHGGCLLLGDRPGGGLTASLRLPLKNLERASGCAATLPPTT